MAPHRALTISEITRGIFQEVQILDMDDVDDEGESCQPTLVSLATCCKMLSSIALDILWRHMESLLPVFQTIPSFQLSNGAYVLHRTSPHHFTRFDHYAQRIRIFDLNGQPDLPIDALALARILQLRNSAPLFPGLRGLIWRGRDIDGIELMLLLSPSLRSVEIGDSTGLNSAESFIHALADEAPLLEKLDLHDLASKSLSISSVCQFQHIRSLRVENAGLVFHSNNFIQLSSLQNLQFLNIDLHDSSPAASGISHPLRLPSLCKLILYGHLAHIATFLENLTAPSLATITIGNRAQEPAPAQWRACLQQIGSRFRDSLRAFVAADHYKPAFVPTIVRWFEPLFVLHKLEQLSLRVAGLHITSDKDALELASAWPALRFLDVANVNAPNRPTMALFQSFATLCPGLKCLALGVNADALPDIDSTPVMAHGLRELVLPCQPIKYPTAIARYLDRLFPSLHSITHYDITRAGSQTEQLGDSLRMFQAVRADENIRKNVTKSP